MIRRRTLFRWHHIFGLWAGIVLLIISVTGLLLTFRSQLRTPTPNARPTAEPLSLPKLLHRVEQDQEGTKVTDIHLPEEPDEPYEFYLDDDDETLIFVDGQGQILERRKTAQGFTRILLQIHTGEMFGIPGQGVATLAGLSLCLLIYTGVAMYLRRRKK